MSVKSKQQARLRSRLCCLFWCERGQIPRHRLCARKENLQAARKPNFVLDDHSSRRCIATSLQQPTRRFRSYFYSPGRDGPSRARWKSRPSETPCLFGLAPCGVYRAVCVATNAVGSYPTLSPLPPLARRRFAFCCTGRLCVLRRKSRTLSGTLPCGVRTFLPRTTASCVRQRSSGRLHLQDYRG